MSNTAFTSLAAHAAKNPLQNQQTIYVPCLPLILIDIALKLPLDKWTPTVSHTQTVLPCSVNSVISLILWYLGHYDAAIQVISLD